MYFVFAFTHPSFPSITYVYYLSFLRPMTHTLPSILLLPVILPLLLLQGILVIHLFLLYFLFLFPSSSLDSSTYRFPILLFVCFHFWLLLLFSILLSCLTLPFVSDTSLFLLAFLPLKHYYITPTPPPKSQSEPPYLYQPTDHCFLRGIYQGYFR